MKTLRLAAMAFLLAAGPWSLATAQDYTSPPAETSVTIDGKKITIKYHAPSMHGRRIFGDIVPWGQVWRAGADEATALHTDADLLFQTLRVPKGDYTIFVIPQEGRWEFIVNKQTGQWGLEYDPARDLGRIPMDMAVSPTPIQTFKITLLAAGGNKGNLRMSWETTIAAVPFTVK